MAVHTAIPKIKNWNNIWLLLGRMPNIVSIDTLIFSSNQTDSIIQHYYIGIGTVAPSCIRGCQGPCISIVVEFQYFTATNISWYNLHFVIVNHRSRFGLCRPSSTCCHLRPDNAIRGRPDIIFTSTISFHDPKLIVISKWRSKITSRKCLLAVWVQATPSLDRF